MLLRLSQFHVVWCMLEVAPRNSLTWSQCEIARMVNTTKYCGNNTLVYLVSVRIYMYTLAEFNKLEGEGFLHTAQCNTIWQTNRKLSGTYAKNGKMDRCRTGDILHSCHGRLMCENIAHTSSASFCCCCGCGSCTSFVACSWIS